MVHSPQSIATRQLEVLLARSAVYHALSMVLRHPGTETATWLASGEHRRLIDVVEMLETGDGGPLPEVMRRLVTVLDAVSVSEWTREHERIFGHSVQSAAPPYELEYGEEHSHRQPQELADIAAFYQAFGLRVSSASHERVDHIVTECEFMQYLLYKHACALDEGSLERAEVCEAAARQFLADHLGCWGPAFCLRLSRAAAQACLPRPRRRQGILGAVAAAALAWLVQDCQHLGIPAGSRDLPLRLPKERDDPTTCLPACGGPASRGEEHRSSGPKTGGWGEVGCAAACLPAEAASGCSGAAQAGLPAALHHAAQAGALQQPGCADGKY